MKIYIAPTESGQRIYLAKNDSDFIYRFAICEGYTPEDYMVYDDEVDKKKRKLALWLKTVINVCRENPDSVPSNILRKVDSKYKHWNV